MYKLSSFFNHFSPVDTPLQKAPQPDFDASVCTTKFGTFCLNDLPPFNLTLSTPKEPHALIDCFILSLPGMNNPGLVIVFLVVVNTLAVDELAELLGQFKTSDLLILWIPKQ